MMMLVLIKMSMASTKLIPLTLTPVLIPSQPRNHGGRYIIDRDIMQAIGGPG